MSLTIRYDDAVDWYTRTAGLATADRFVDAVSAIENSIPQHLQ